MSYSISHPITHGVFTPTYLGEDTAGVTTYISQVGIWTRVDNIVTLTLLLEWSGATGSGNAIVAGLPYNCHTALEQVGSLIAQNHGGNPSTCCMISGIKTFLLMNTGGVAQSVDTAAKIWINATYITEDF